MPTIKFAIYVIKHAKHALENYNQTVNLATLNTTINYQFKLVFVFS